MDDMMLMSPTGIQINVAPQVQGQAIVLRDLQKRSMRF